MYGLNIFAGPVFENVSTWEWTQGLLLLGFLFYLLAYLLPSMLVSLFYNVLRKVKKPQRKQTYLSLWLASLVLFVLFWPYLYLEWILNYIPFFPFYIGLYLYIQYLQFKKLDKLNSVK